MRIAFVVHGYPPVEAAGVELVAKEQADALAARGHEVSVFARALEPRRREGDTWDERVDGVPVRRVVSNYAPRASFRELYDNHLFDEPFRAFLRERRPEIVHAQHLVLLSPGLLGVARDEGAAVVLGLHDAFYLCHRLFLLDRDGRRCPGPDAGERCIGCLSDQAAPEAARERFAYMARALALPDAVVAPSAALARRYAAELPFLEGRVTVVDPGVPAAGALAALRRGRAAAQERETAPRVRLTFIGTWLRHKGLDLLLDALSGIDPALWQLHVHGGPVAGDGGYARDLQGRSRSLPVRWRGSFAREALPDVLREADVLVLPSRCDESYSRVVREARLAGLAVVAPACGGPAEALDDGVDALLVAPDSREDLARALERVICDHALRARISAAPASWPTVADGVAHLEAVYAEALCTRAGRLASGGTRRPTRVTVAYVTKNGAAWLEGSLRAVRRQRGDFELVEVLAVDSGSTDGTLEILARHDARVLRIPPAEFGHGRTRNLAARESRGDVVVFLTQDAEPANEGWLAALVEALDGDPLLAGVWSRHAPRPGCHPMEWRQLREFPLFQADAPRVSSARGNPDYAAHPELYYWFSNNGSAIRREVLARWPFPDVDFAEDQAWARLVLEAGWKTALIPESLILHSHAYSPWTNLRRHLDHARAMARDLGQRDTLTLGEALRAAARETRRDVAFWAGFRRRTRLRVAARWGVPALAYHLGAFTGRWLGSRAARLPEGLLDRLSLHESLRAGGGERRAGAVR